MQFPYLQNLAFKAEHKGPYNVDRHGHRHGRNPSPSQIRKMCEEIRRCFPRDPVGPSTLWRIPQVEDIFFE